MSDITHTATIQLKLDFKPGAALTRLQQAIDTIANAFDLAKASDSFEKLQQKIEELQLELTEAGKKAGQADEKFEKLTKSNTALRGAMTKLRNDFKAVSTEIKSTAQNSEKLSEALEIRSSALGKLAQFQQKYGGLTKELKSLAAQTQKTVGSEQKHISTLAALNRQISVVIAKEEEHRNLMKNSLMYRLSHYEKQVDAVYRASYRLAMTGSNLTQFARSIAMTGMQFMNEFGEYQFNLNRAAGAVQIWEGAMIEGQDGTKMLSDSVLDLAKNMKIIPAREVAEAMYFWGTATGTVINSTETLETSMNALDKIMRASIMTNTGYEDTIKGVYSILTQFYGGALEKAGEVTEQLFYITQKTALEFNDLIQSFKMVGPVAAQAGVSFEEMVTLLGRLGDLGIRGSMAGRAFRQMFIQMVRPSGPAKKAIDNLFNSVSANVDKLGDDYRSFGGKSYLQIMFPEGEFIGIEGYIRNLALAVDTLTRSERNAFLGRISTANELPVLTALVSDAIRELHGLNSEADKSIDFAAEAASYFENNWKRFANSWKGMVGSVQRGWEAIKISVGGLIAEGLAPFVEILRQAMDAMHDWVNDPANAGIIRFLGQFAAGLAALSAALGTILTIMGSIAGLAASAYLIIRTFGKYVPMVSGFAAVAGAFITGLVRNFDDLRNTVVEALGTINGVAGSTEDVLGGLGALVMSVVEPLNLVVDAMFGFVGIAIKLVGVVVRLAEELAALKPIMAAIGAAIGFLVTRNMLRWVATMVQARVAAYARAPAHAAAAISATGAAAAQATTSIGLMGRAMGAVTGLMGGPIGWIALAATIGSVAYDVFPEVKGFVDSITSAFRDTNKEAQDFITSLGDMGTVVNANFRKLADSEYSKQFQENLVTAREAVRTAEFDPGTGQYWADAFGQRFALQGNPVDNLEDNAAEFAKMVTPSSDSITTKMIERLKLAIAGINSTRIAAGIAPVVESEFAAVIAEATSRVEAITGTTGQANFMVALWEHLAKTVSPTASQGEIERAIRAYLESAWAGTQFAMEEGISSFDMDRAAARLASIAFDKPAVDKNMSEILTGIWAPYVNSVIESIEDGADPAEVQRLLTTTFGGKGSGSLSGSLSEVLLQLDEETRAQLDAALRAHNMGGTDEIIGADTQKTLQTMHSDKYQALIAAVGEAQYRGFEEAELATRGQYQNALEGILTGQLDLATDAVLSLEDTLRNRALSNDAYLAWVEVMKYLVAAGVLDLDTMNSIVRQIAPKAAKEILTAAQQITKDISEVVANEAPDSQTLIDQLFVSLGNVYRSGSIREGSGIGGARAFWDRMIVPALQGAELTADQKKYILEWAEAILPGGLSEAGLDLLTMTMDQRAAAVRSKLTEIRTGVLRDIRSMTYEVQGAVAAAQAAVLNVIKATQTAGDDSPESLAKNKRDWLDDLMGSTIPTPKDIREAIKRTKGMSSRLRRQSFAGLRSLDLMQLLGSKSPISREAGRDIADTYINTIVAGYNAAGPKGQRRIRNSIVKMLNDPTVPEYIKRQLGKYLSDGIANIEVETPATGGMTGSSGNSFMDTMYKNLGLAGKGGTTEKKPLEVFMRVHVKQTGANKATERVQNAHTKIKGFLDSINRMDWAGTGLRAGTALAEGLYKGATSKDIVGTITTMRNRLSGLGWRIGGHAAGYSWISAFETAVINNIDPLLLKLARLFIGASPPPEGPLSLLAKGGYNSGDAWGASYTEGVMNRMKDAAQNVQKFNSERVGIYSEQSYNTRRVVEIHMDVSSKDGSVDRAKQGEFRRGAMDALVAADLEHYVTVS
jgi:TP901 family phage tail tape measure protein